VDVAYGTPSTNLLQQFSDVLLQYDFAGGDLHGHLLPDRSRPAVTVWSEPHDAVGQLLGALQRAAAGELSEPARIGETEAGRARRLVL
jgi:hypothetical protein